MSQSIVAAPSAMAEKSAMREVLGEPPIRLVVVSCALLLIAIGLVSLVVFRAPRL